MKTILNISLGLMVVAAAIGSNDFISMYRSGEIDKIYEHESTPTTAHCTTPATPVASIVTPAPELNAEKEVPFTAPVTKTKIKPITTTLAETKAIEVPAPELATASLEKVAIADGQSEIPKPVVKKKLSLKMYSRAIIRDEEIVEDLRHAAMPIDSLTGESRK